MMDALDFLKMLADDTRWALVRALALSDYQVGELVALLDLPQNLISYHLGILRQAGLVQTHRSEADARVLYYGLERSALQAAYREIGAVLQLVASDTKPEAGLLVLFVCTGNSARSQMAEAWLRHLSNGRITVRSAGTQPEGLHPLALACMAEVGIDIGYHQSKDLQSVIDLQPQLVITVCDRAREQCPDWQSAPIVLHWSIADPVLVGDDALAAFRLVRDELRERISSLITGLPRLLSLPV